MRRVSSTIRILSVMRVRVFVGGERLSELGYNGHYHKQWYIEVYE